jgi:hypothetical protein
VVCGACELVVVDDQGSSGVGRERPPNPAVGLAGAGWNRSRGRPTADGTVCDFDLVTANTGEGDAVLALLEHTLT